MEYTEVEEDFSNRRLYQKVRVSPSELERSCGSFILYARSHPELRFLRNEDRLRYSRLERRRGCGNLRQRAGVVLDSRSYAV